VPKLAVPRADSRDSSASRGSADPKNSRSDSASSAAGGATPLGFLSARGTINDDINKALASQTGRR